METAWKTAAVDPVMVVMRSGQEPSEMVIRALLCGCRTSGAPSLLPGQELACPSTHQAPAKAGNGHLLGALIGHPRWWDKVRQASPLPSKPGALGSSPKLRPHLFPDSLYSLSFLQETK